MMIIMVGMDKQKPQKNRGEETANKREKYKILRKLKESKNYRCEEGEGR